MNYYSVLQNHRSDTSCHVACWFHVLVHLEIHRN